MTANLLKLNRMKEAGKKKYTSNFRQKPHRKQLFVTKAQKWEQ